MWKIAVVIGAFLQLGAPRTVEAAPAPDTSATVSFRNDVGKKLRLVEARFTVDAGPTSTSLSAAEPGKSYVVFSGPLSPGRHLVATHLTYQGDRRVFTYMNGYAINVDAIKTVNAPADRPVSFTIVGAENKGLTVPFEKRLEIRVEGGPNKK